MSDVAKANDIRLQKIMENAARSMGDLIAHLGSKRHPQGDSF